MTGSSVELVFILHKGFKGLFRALLSIPLHELHWRTEPIPNSEASQVNARGLSDHSALTALTIVTSLAHLSASC